MCPERHGMWTKKMGFSGSPSSSKWALRTSHLNGFSHTERRSKVSFIGLHVMWFFFFMGKHAPVEKHWDCRWDAKWWGRAPWTIDAGGAWREGGMIDVPETDGVGGGGFTGERAAPGVWVPSLHSGKTTSMRPRKHPGNGWRPKGPGQQNVIQPAKGG